MADLRVEPRVPFWMVYVEGGGQPMQRIEDRDVAVARCEELARTTHHRVFLLEATDYAVPELPKPADTVVQWHHV